MPSTGKSLATNMGLKGEFTYNSHFCGSESTSMIEYVPAPGETLSSVIEKVVSTGLQRRCNESHVRQLIEKGYRLAAKAKARGFISEIPINKHNFYFGTDWVRGDFRSLAYRLPPHPDAKIEMFKRGYNQHYFWTKEQEDEL